MEVVEFTSVRSFRVNHVTFTVDIARGYLSVTSDWPEISGEYRWSNHGCENFWYFLLQTGMDYLHGKLFDRAATSEFDATTTRKDLTRAVRERYRDSDITREHASEAIDDLRWAETEHDFTEISHIEEPWRYLAYVPKGSVAQFDLAWGAFTTHIRNHILPKEIK
jgi:hypothetical protein